MTQILKFIYTYTYIDKNFDVAITNVTELTEIMCKIKTNRIFL